MSYLLLIIGMIFSVISFLLVLLKYFPLNILFTIPGGILIGISIFLILQK